MKRTMIHLAVGAALASSAAGAFAQTCTNISDKLTSQPFSLNISDNTLGQCAGVSAKTAEEFFDSVKSGSIAGLFPGANTTTDAIAVDAAFNSLPIGLSYGSGPALTFTIPGLNVNQVFNGATRDASMELLKDYLKANDIIGKIMNYQAKNSPFSPILGQGGLVPTTMAGDFSSSFTDVATNIAAPASAASAGGASNLIGIGLSYSSGKINDAKTSSISIPLSYTFRNDIDPRRQLVLQLPITYTEIEGAKSLQGGLGVAYRFPMSDNWTLTPGVKYSFVGSADLATVAGVYSATIASTYVMEMGGFDLAIGNMLGMYKTSKFSAGDYSFDPGISTSGMRNGIMLSQPVVIGGSKMSLEYSLIDARYFGDKPFADSSQEINVTLGTNKSAFSARSFIRAGLGYVHAKDSNTVKINFGYWF